MCRFNLTCFLRFSPSFRRGGLSGVTFSFALIHRHTNPVFVEGFKSGVAFFGFRRDVLSDSYTYRYFVRADFEGIFVVVDLRSNFSVMTFSSSS